MTYELRHDGDGAWVFSGDLDLAAADHIRQAVAGASAVTRVDLGGVEFIDSSGLHGLVLIRQAHPACRYVHVPARVRRLFELTGLAATVLGDESDPDTA